MGPFGQRQAPPTAATHSGKTPLGAPLPFRLRAFLRPIPPSQSRVSPPSGDFAMQDVVKEMKLQDLKIKTPTELLSFAEEVGVENASSMRKQEQMFAILKQLAAKDTDIIGTG